ncbi:MAG: hypothetical protein LBR27_06095 [Bifidobacteriaceae bacterium]|nr:hypothetical protein [Bifidobacteriaceae bacterium]
MGRYRLDAELATQVPDCARFRVSDKILARQADLYVLWGGNTDDAIDAARRAALIDDPRLARIIDAGRYAGVNFVLTEPLDGATLGDVGPLPAAQARAIAGEVASALAVASERDVHHQGLTPESVYLPEGTGVKVAGMAWEAAQRGQATSDPIDAGRRDAHALVAVLYAALTARWPGETPSQMAGPPVWDGNPVAPIELVSGVPGDLNTLCSVTLSSKGIGPATPGQVIQDLGVWPPISVLAARLATPRPGPAELSETDTTLDAPNRVAESQVLQELKARLDAVLPPQGATAAETTAQLEPAAPATAPEPALPAVAPVAWEDVAAEAEPEVLPDLAEEFFGTGDVGVGRPHQPTLAAPVDAPATAEVPLAALDTGPIVGGPAADLGSTDELPFGAAAAPAAATELPEPAPALDPTRSPNAGPTDEVVAALAAQAEIQEKLAAIEALLGPLETEAPAAPVVPVPEPAGRRSRSLTDDVRQRLLADLDAALSEPEPEVAPVPEPAKPTLMDQTEVFEPAVAAEFVEAVAAEPAPPVDLLGDIEVPQAPYGVGQAEAAVVAPEPDLAAVVAELKGATQAVVAPVEAEVAPQVPAEPEVAPPVQAQPEPTPEPASAPEPTPAAEPAAEPEPEPFEADATHVIAPVPLTEPEEVAAPAQPEEPAPEPVPVVEEAADTTPWASVAAEEPAAKAEAPKAASPEGTKASSGTVATPAAAATVAAGTAEAKAEAAKAATSEAAKDSAAGETTSGTEEAKAAAEVKDAAETTAAEPPAEGADTEAAEGTEKDIFDTTQQPFDDVLDGPDFKVETPPRKWRSVLVFAITFIVVVAIGIAILNATGVIKLGGQGLAPAVDQTYAANLAPFWFI